MNLALILSLVTASFAAEPPAPKAKPKPPIELPANLSFPTVGKAVAINLNGAAATAKSLCFVYQPDSRVVKVQWMPAKSALSWKPERHGIVSIRAMSIAAKSASDCLDKKKVLAARDVSVRFSGLPLSGVLIFLGAGLVLFGGVFLSMRLIFAQTE